MSCNVDESVFVEIRGIVFARMQKLYPGLKIKHEMFQRGELEEDDLYEIDDFNEWNYLLATIDVIKGKQDASSLHRGIEEFDSPEKLLSD